MRGTVNPIFADMGSDEVRVGRAVPKGHQVPSAIGQTPGCRPTAYPSHRACGEWADGDWQRMAEQAVERGDAALVWANESIAHRADAVESSRRHVEHTQRELDRGGVLHA